MKLPVSARKSARFITHSRTRVYALIAVVAIITLAQLVHSNTSALSSWKGGGFGMYTDPHPTRRVVWLGLESADGAWPVKLMLPAERLYKTRAGLGAEDRRAFDAALLLAREMRTYPRDALAANLAEQLRRLEWRLSGTGEVGLVEGAPLAVERFRLEVYELRTDIQAGSIGVEKVYDHSIPN